MLSLSFVAGAQFVELTNYDIVIVSHIFSLFNTKKVPLDCSKGTDYLFAIP